MGRQGMNQILDEVDTMAIVGCFKTPGCFPGPGDDILLSPSSQWFVNAYWQGSKNYDAVYRRSDGAYARNQGLDHRSYRGDLRSAPAHCPPQHDFQDQASFSLSGWTSFQGQVNRSKNRLRRNCPVAPQSIQAELRMILPGDKSLESVRRSSVVFLLCAATSLSLSIASRLATPRSTRLTRRSNLMLSARPPFCRGM